MLYVVSKLSVEEAVGHLLHLLMLRKTLKVFALKALATLSSGNQFFMCCLRLVVSDQSTVFLRLKYGPVRIEVRAKSD